MVGILLINILGNYLSIRDAALVACAIPVTLFLTFIWMPESPCFLIQRKDEKNALDILVKLRGADKAQIEFANIITFVEEEKDKKATILDLFKVKENRKGALVAYGLRAIQQFCGTTALIFYCKSIFEESKDVISPNVSTVLYFTLQLIIAFLSTFFVDSVGRKPLLIFSLFGASTSLLCFSVFLYLRDCTTIDVSHLTFISLLTLLLNVSFISVGVRNIPLLMMGEMFSTKIKPIALCCGTISYSILALLTSEFFYLTSGKFGLYLPFSIFTILGFLSILFVIFIVPETKGKSLEDIQRELKAGASRTEEEEAPKESYRSFVIG